MIGIQRLFRPRERTPRLETTQFPDPVPPTFGEENSDEVLVANQTFVSAVPVEGIEIPDSIAFRRRGLQEEESATTTVPSSQSRLRAVESEHRIEQQRQPQQPTNSSEHRTTQRAVDSLEQPQNTEGVPDVDSTSNTNASHQGRRRGRRVRFRNVLRRRPHHQNGTNNQSRHPDATNNNESNENGELWNALELHPRLQQALLDLYWQRRERELINQASARGPTQAASQRVTDFVNEQEMALAFLQRRVHPTEPPPTLSVTESCTNDQRTQPALITEAQNSAIIGHQTGSRNQPPVEMLTNTNNTEARNEEDLAYRDEQSGTNSSSIEIEESDSSGGDEEDDHITIFRDEEDDDITSYGFHDEDYMDDEQLRIFFRELEKVANEKEGLNQSTQGRSEQVLLEQNKAERERNPSDECRPQIMTERSSAGPNTSLDGLKEETNGQEEDQMIRRLSQKIEEDHPIIAENTEGLADMLFLQQETMRPTEAPGVMRSSSQRRLGLEENDDDASAAPICAGHSKAPPNLKPIPSSPSMRSATGIRTLFQCQCCFETKETRHHGLCCDDLHRPHMYCADCVRRYLWLARETRDPMDYNAGESLCRIPCFSTNDGSCTGCVFVNLDRIFTRQQLNQWKEEHASLMQQEQTGVEREEENLVGQAMARAMEKIQNAMKEALTNVKVRSCPKCNQAFVKNDDGCNKMKCPVCKTTSCYLCRKEVSPDGYDHFVNRAPVNGLDPNGKCPLWTDNSVDQLRDQDEMRQVIFELANKVWEEYLRMDVQEGGQEDVSNASVSSSVADLLARLPQE